MRWQIKTYDFFAGAQQIQQGRKTNGNINRIILSSQRELHYRGTYHPPQPASDRTPNALPVHLHISHVRNESHRGNANSMQSDETQIITGSNLRYFNIMANPSCIVVDMQYKLSLSYTFILYQIYWLFGNSFGIFSLILILYFNYYSDPFCVICNRQTPSNTEMCRFCSDSAAMR